MNKLLRMRKIDFAVKELIDVLARYFLGVGCNLCLKNL